jgi:hypothetical protein
VHKYLSVKDLPEEEGAGRGVHVAVQEDGGQGEKAKDQRGRAEGDGSQPLAPLLLQAEAPAPASRFLSTEAGQNLHIQHDNK